MRALLFVWAACQGDPAQAGAAYQAALQAIEQERYDDAVARLQEALRQEPREAERLQYRDAQGRHKEPYYPHRTWAEARMLQARRETDAARQRQCYREAITHLELTIDPRGAELLGKARAALALLEDVPAAAPPPDAAVTALRTRIDALCDGEEFEEALQLIELQKPLLATFPAERTQIEGQVHERRKAALDRYARLLSLGLESSALASPLENPEAIPALLRPALPSKKVAEQPGPAFAWASLFLAAWEQKRGPERFEELSVDAPSPAAFRAAWNVSLAMRGASLDRDGGITEAEQACERAERAWSGRGLSAPPSLAAFRQRVQRLRERREEQARGNGELLRWSERAEAALFRGPAMADPSALREASKSLNAIEASRAWNELPPPPRARAQFLAALLEATAALLDGAAIPERASESLAKARALDPEAGAAWKGRLSPRLEDWIGR